MNFSSQKGQLGPGLLPSRMNTGTLRKILEEVISAEESELHSIKPSFLQEKKNLQRRKIKKKTSLQQKKETKKVLTYTRQLADPRWKAKRQVILTRDEFNCANCGATSSLHVHHIKYTGYTWEAPDEDLITLCNVCHKKVHEGTLEIVVEEYPLDGKIIYPIENTNPPEFDLYMYGATDKDMPYLAVNRYGSKENPGDFFINDIRAWGYRD